MPLTFNIDDGMLRGLLGGMMCGASESELADALSSPSVSSRLAAEVREFTRRRAAALAGGAVAAKRRDGRPRPTVRATVSYRARTEDGEAVIGDETMDVTDALDLLSDDAAHALLSPSWARREGVDRRAAEEALFKVANTLAGHETFDGGRLTLSEEDGHSDPVGYFTVRFGRE